jgi:hypothetical protein
MDKLEHGRWARRPSKWLLDANDTMVDLTLEGLSGYGSSCTLKSEVEMEGRTLLMTCRTCFSFTQSPQPLMAAKARWGKQSD